MSEAESIKEQMSIGRLILGGLSLGFLSSAYVLATQPDEVIQILISLTAMVLLSTLYFVKRFEKVLGRLSEF